MSTCLHERCVFHRDCGHTEIAEYCFYNKVLDNQDDEVRYVELHHVNPDISDVFINKQEKDAEKGSAV